MDYDPSDEIKATDDVKAGIKGIVDSGIVEIPRIFIRPPHELAEELNMVKSMRQVLVVDLSGIEVEDRRKKVVDEIREACEKWGLFQLINHGVPSSVLEGMTNGTNKFHEQDVEVKKGYYSSDPTDRRVRYDRNCHAYKAKGKTANWKDSLYISELVSGHIETEEIPKVYRYGVLIRGQYSGLSSFLVEDILLGSLSKALGLKTNHLKDTGACLIIKGILRTNMSSPKESQAELTMEYDRLKELKAFDDTKAGVKALVDAGIVEIPRIFIRPPDELAEELKQGKSTLHVPVVDLNGIEVQDQRKKVVDEIREASEKWGFFQLINHGVPSSVLQRMIDGTGKFHEQDAELKKEYYSRDRTNRRVRYETDLHLFNSKMANWRDTLNISMIVTGNIDPEEIPEVCRKEFFEFMNHIRKLGETLFNLLSEALGLKLEHLNAMECTKGQTLVCHYYPACPQPELTLGTDRHTDPDFLTILLQDQSGGLQVVHNNQWVDVEPIEQGLVVNIGDFLQILSNDKFISVNHRVVAKKVGPRISVACFFTGVFAPPKMYGPIKELISEEKTPLYKEFLVSDYIAEFFARPLDKSGLDLFRL